MDELMRRFCLTCGNEFDFALAVCPCCGAQAADGDFDTNLVRALSHRIPDVAATAARVLGERAPREALEPLLAASRSDDPERAEAALEALARYDDARVDARLREAGERGTARERAIARAVLRRRAEEPRRS